MSGCLSTSVYLPPNQRHILLGRAGFAVGRACGTLRTADAVSEALFSATSLCQSDICADSRAWVA